MKTDEEIWDKLLREGKAGIKESVMDMLKEAREDILRTILDFCDGKSDSPLSLREYLIVLRERDK